MGLTKKYGSPDEIACVLDVVSTKLKVHGEDITVPDLRPILEFCTKNPEYINRTWNKKLSDFLTDLSHDKQDTTKLSLGQIRSI